VHAVVAPVDNDNMTKLLIAAAKLLSCCGLHRESKHEDDDED